MKDQTRSIAWLNDASKQQFMEVLGDIVEHSPWVADCAFSSRPFASVEDLNAALIDCVRAATADSRIALFNRHPELAGQEAVAGSMTQSSTSEQERLGLTRLSPAQFERLAHLNRDYRATFGFPFITAVRLHDDLESVMAHGEARLKNSSEIEVVATLEQISEIVYGRLCKIFHAGSAVRS